MKSLNQAISADQVQWIRWQLIIKPITMGLFGIWGLSTLYIGLLSRLESFNFAIKQSMNIAHWIIPLLFGVGIQITLFYYIRGFKNLVDNAVLPKRRFITSVGLSGSALLACCLIYAAGILPLAGFSAFMFYFSQQQITLMIISIVINAFSIIYLLKFIHQNGLTINNGNLIYLSFRNSIFLFAAVTLLTLILIGIILY